MREFIKELLSDLPGVSFGRAASLVLIAAVVVWISFFLWKTSHTPAGVRFPDVATIAALNALALSFYGLGKGIGKTAEILGAQKAEGEEKKQ